MPTPISYVLISLNVLTWGGLALVGSTAPASETHRWLDCSTQRGYYFDAPLMMLTVVAALGGLLISLHRPGPIREWSIAGVWLALLVTLMVLVPYLAPYSGGI